MPNMAIDPLFQEKILSPEVTQERHGYNRGTLRSAGVFAAGYHSMPESSI
jgi:hypothetical protein